MDSEDDLDILTALIEESEGVGAEDNGPEQADDLDGLFDEDDEEEYKDGTEATEHTVSDLFGDGDEIENEDSNTREKEEVSETLNRSKEDLQEELRQMQEKMKLLKQQLEMKQMPSTSSSTPVKTTVSTKGVKKTPPPQQSSELKPLKATVSAQKTKTQAVATSSAPVPRTNSNLQESCDFSAQLNIADSFKRKPRVAHGPKGSTSAEDRGPLVEIKLGSSFQPVQSTSVCAAASQSRTRPGPSGGHNNPNPPTLPTLPKDVAMEKYSGLRLRKPRVSSIEMEQKMGGRRLIRLSQLPQRLTVEKLEDSDWVTFAVLVHKATPQSNSSGKTFSIWKLNDLHNLEVCVSLLLFGEVHKEHWKTEPGTVIGLLNPNPMKPKEGYDGVSLTVDHPQKVLLMGEAQDYGTCKAMKKNGDPCSQVVNMYECQFCQYHVKAQYKKMSSKRAELQSSFSGKAPGRVKGKNANLRERLCQDGFYYGGVSSAACAASLAVSKPHKPVQKSIDQLFVKGSSQLVDQAQRLAMQSGKVSGCSEEFRSLMLMPTPGALQLKKHLALGQKSAPKDGSGAPFQSISASDLLKQQKHKQQELLENRRQRAQHLHSKEARSSGGATPGFAPPRREAVTSPKTASNVSKTTPTGPKTTPPGLKTTPTFAKTTPPGLKTTPTGRKTTPTGLKTSPSDPKATPTGPTLGRGFCDGEDILFFDNSPPPVPACSGVSLSAAKMAALKKLRAKGAGLEKEDPNALKRKQRNDNQINARVEKNLLSHNGEGCRNEEEGEEPAQKKQRHQLEYVQSEEFQKILSAQSRHVFVLQAAEYQLQERYFDALVKKEQMEEKMKGIKEMKCRAVSCKKCNYTYFKPADRCVGENHDLRWHDALKRFFKCPCGQRAVALDRLPHKSCSNCGLFKWEHDGMLKEKTGPKIGRELLLPRGEEHAKFLNSMK